MRSFDVASFPVDRIVALDLASSGGGSRKSSVHDMSGSILAVGGP